jgi:gliding motility-associated protein GldM
VVTGFYLSKKQNSVVKINATKMNIFYIGVDNLLSVTVPGLPEENLSVVSSEGAMVRKNSAGGFIVNASSAGNVLISVSEKNGNKITFLDSMQFRVKRIPDPVISIGGIKGEGTLSHDELAGLTEIYATLENFDFDCKYDVVSFSMSCDQNGKPIELSQAGSKLSDVMKATLFFQPAGSKIFFHEITVKGPDGILRKVPGVMIKVK